MDAFAEAMYDSTLTLKGDKLFEIVHFYKHEMRRVSRQLTAAHEGDLADWAGRIETLRPGAEDALGNGNEAEKRLEEAIERSTAFK